MTNNDIFKKLRVALMLRDDDILEILKLVDFTVSKSELGAFFRKEDHPNYVECGDQILRNFLNGLVIYLRGTKEAPVFPGDVLKTKQKAQLVKSNKTAEAKNSSFKARPKGKRTNDISPVKYKNKSSQKKGNKKS